MQTYCERKTIQVTAPLTWRNYTNLEEVSDAKPDASVLQTVFHW